jgi:hypothetical protein
MVNLGGFYQDEIAYTGVKVRGIGCKECPPGKYVTPERAPGLAETDCQSCPIGISNICSIIRANKRIHVYVTIE